MKNNIDIARDNLKEQRRLVTREITALNRQLTQLDKALAALEPVDKAFAATRKSIPRAEAQRRLDVVEKYLESRNGEPFTAGDVIEGMAESADLRPAYAHMLKRMADRGEMVQVHVPGVRGGRHTTFVRKG